MLDVERGLRSQRGLPVKYASEGLGVRPDAEEHIRLCTCPSDIAARHLGSSMVFLSNSLTLSAVVHTAGVTKSQAPSPLRHREAAELDSLAGG